MIALEDDSQFKKSIQMLVKSAFNLKTGNSSADGSVKTQAFSRGGDYMGHFRVQVAPYNPTARARSGRGEHEGVYYLLSERNVVSTPGFQHAGRE